MLGCRPVRYGIHTLMHAKQGARPHSAPYLFIADTSSQQLPSSNTPMLEFREATDAPVRSPSQVNYPAFNDCPDPPSAEAAL